MKKVSLDIWIQLIGMLSVLAGLIFVGLEMRLSQQIALAAQQQERASLVTEVIGSFAEANPPISFLDFIDENLDLSNQDIRAVAETYVYRIWMVYENDYLQYELGLMDEDIWQAKIASMRYVYSRCQYKEVTARALSFSSADLLTLLDDPNTRSCEE
ncbi:MAG: hypothetical protein CMQ41_01410 [Gammaproteobacteria bacterium]|nr:hypothetical protein [Gammaproteobacteria bacterium]